MDPGDTIQDWLASRLHDEHVFITEQLCELVQAIEERHSKIVIQARSRGNYDNVSESRINAYKIDDYRGASFDLPSMVLQEESTCQLPRSAGSIGSGKVAWSAPEAEASKLQSKPPPEQVKMRATRKANIMLALGYDDTEKSSCLQRLVSSIWFELLSGALILMNILMMALEIQYHGWQSGYNLRLKDYDRPAGSIWPGGQDIFIWIELGFNIVFAIELILRFAAGKCEALRSIFIWLDVVLVVLGLLEAAGSASQANASFINPAMMRVVRLARVVRILKMLRTVKTMDSLYLILRSIQASVGAAFWSFMLLLAMQVATGMLFNQLLRKYIDDSSADMAARRAVFSYWGTFTRTMVTMFEITLANWSPSCRTLIDNVSEWYGLAYIIYRCMFCFAVVRVISAVFLTETQRVAAADDEIAIMKSLRARKQQLQRLHNVFSAIDVSGDGEIERSELHAVLQEPGMVQWFHTLDIDVSDVEEVFSILDDGDGKISAEEFINGIHKLRGSAKALDMVSLSSAVTKLAAKVEMITGSATSRKLP